MLDSLAPISLPPEAHASFRRGQLLLLLAQFDEPVSIDRVGYLEFFAANPFLVFRSDEKERSQLRLAGFNPSALSYQATTERYANRRTRLRSDLAALASWGYLSATVVDGRLACSLTEVGRERAESMNSLYADAYRLSVSLVRPKMRGTDTALAKRVQSWLKIGRMRIDLLDAELSVDPSQEGRLL